MKRWMIRIALGVLALLLLGAGLVTFDYHRWRSAGLAAFPTNASTLATTARGPVEYAELGRGRPVLEIHGSPGGFDQLYTLLRMKYGDNGPPYRAILPSRPGYLRTPLSTGKTPAEQADAMAALLDVLKIQRVAVVGTSDGGPSALQFAMRHGDRCSALILVSAVVHKIPADADLPPALKLIFEVMPKDFVGWMFGKLMLGPLRKAGESDPEGLAMGEALMRGTVPFAQREDGLWNDVANDKQIKDWPLRDIRCPTLVVHGTADVDVPISHGDSAATHIPGAKFVRLDGADHFAFIVRRKEIDSTIAVFLAGHPDPMPR